MRLPEFLKTSKKELYTIAFYNVENLFDTRQDKTILDTDFIPTSDKKWDDTRYQQKLNKIATAIAAIGPEEHQYPPMVVGLAEVENKRVLEDLVTTEILKDKNYAFVHYNSPDERGIDTAFLYRKNLVTIKDSQSHQLYIKRPEGNRDFTRDILEVSCSILGEDMTFLINHWPSRRDGWNSTAYKRLEAAKQNAEIIDDAKTSNPNQNFIVMGDFNDDPKDDSVKHLETTSFLYNPMELLLTHRKGTTKHKGRWNLFDQILISQNLLKFQKKKLNFKSAAIFDPDFLKQQKGRYKGTPYRTFGGRNYTGGYSDHFPVYIILEKG